MLTRSSAVHPDDAARVLQRLQDRPVLWIKQAPGAPAGITPRQPALPAWK